MSFTIHKTKVITYPPSALRDFQVYGYEWVDNLHFVQPLREFIADPGAYIQAARERFLAAGWDGNGRIGLLWLPPFVFPKEVPPEGIVVWHVKQMDDGVSWLLSPVPLPWFQGQAAGQEIVDKVFPPS